MIGKKELKIKIYDSWDEVTIAMFYAIQELQKMYAESKNAAYLLDIINILSDAERDDLDNIPPRERSKIISRIEFLSTLPKGELKKKYKVGGYILVRPDSPADMGTAQYIDFMSAAESGEMSIEKTLSYVLVPDSEKYKGGAVREEIEKAIYENMSVTDAEALRSFFLMYYEVLERSIHPSGKMNKALVLRPFSPMDLKSGIHGSFLWRVWRKLREYPSRKQQKNQ